MEPTIDDLARRAAAEVHAQAQAVADTEAGLADLRSGASGSAPVVRAAGAAPDRRRWAALLVASAAAVLIAAVVVAVRREDEPGRIHTSQSTVAPTTASPATTVPGTVTPTTGPTSTIPSTTAPAVTGEPPTLTAADSEVLYTASVGSATDQLGREDCTECDPLRPLAPLVADDGRVVIGDPVNHRFVVVDHGVPSVVPLTIATLHDEISWQGNIYALQDHTETNGSTGSIVQVQTISDLLLAGFAPSQQYGALGTCCIRFLIDLSAPQPTDASSVVAGAGGAALLRLKGAPTVTETLDPTNDEIVVVTSSSAAAPWRFTRTHAAMPELHPLPDGSVVAIDSLALDQRTTWIVTHLRLDGATTREELDPGSSPADNVGRWSVGLDGLTMLRYDETTKVFSVIRFPLPTVEVTQPGTVTSEVPTTEPAGAAAVDVGNGLTMAGLPATPSRIVHRESQVSSVGRADYHAFVEFDGFPALHVLLGANADNGLPTTPVQIGSVTGWTTSAATWTPSTADEPAVGWQVGPDTWIRLTNADDATPERSWTRDQLVALARQVAWDQAADARHLNDPVTSPVDPPTVGCTHSPKVFGGAPGDLVLFTCAGDLAVFDGTTGARKETIVHFDQTVTPDGGESGPPTVDSITVSPDGSTIFYSVGPEPVSDNRYRYVLGSHAEPTPVGGGIQTAFSPDGSTLAVASLDMLQVGPVDSADLPVIPLYGMYPSNVRFSPEGTQVAFDAGNGAVGIFDRATTDVVLHSPGDAAATASATWGTPGLVVTGDSIGPVATPWARGVMVGALVPRG